MLTMGNEFRGVWGILFVCFNFSVIRIKTTSKTSSLGKHWLSFAVEHLCSSGSFSSQFLLDFQICYLYIMCHLKVFKLCRKTDAHQDDFILRADVLKKVQFHIVSASNCDEWRDITWGFVRSFGPTFLIGKSTGMSRGSFVYFCPSWVCFDNLIGGGFLRVGNCDLQMRQKYVSYAYMQRGVIDFYWALGKMRKKMLR